MSRWGGMGAEDTSFLEDAYELGEEIGRGSAGVVRRGRSRVDGAPVAVKIPLGTLDDEGRTRILREAHLLQELDQPGLTRLHGCFPTRQGRLALVYELVPGRPLDQSLREGRADRGRLASWLRALGEALDALHAAGFVHRDVKPANVMVTPQGEVKLCDFGLLKPVEGGHTITKTGEIFGTPFYIAPELLQGERPSPASDRYALGCLAYELVTGRPPFQGDQLEVISAHLHQDPPAVKVFGDDRDRRLQLVLERMLAKAAGDRYATAGAAAAALGEALTATPAPPRAGVSGEQTSLRSGGIASARGSASDATPLRPRPRRRAPWVAAFGVLLVLGLGVAFRAGRGAPPAEPPPSTTPAPTSAPTPAGADGPLGAEPEARVRRELAALPAPLQVADSRRYREVLASLPSIAAWRLWLLRHQGVEGLTVVQRRSLAEAGKVFEDEGLLSPFRPFLAEPSPVCAMDETDWLEALDLVGLTGQAVPTAGPWLCLAAASAKVALARTTRFEKDLREVPRGPYPGGIPLPEGALLFAFKTPNLETFLDECRGRDRSNVPAWHWIRPALAELRVAMAAGWRSLREEPATRRLASHLLTSWIYHARALFLSPLAEIPTPLLLGGEPEDPHQALVAIELLWVQHQMQEKLARTRGDAQLERLVVVHEGLPEPDPPQDSLGIRAWLWRRRRLLDAYLTLGRRADHQRLFEQFRARVDGDPRFRDAGMLRILGRHAAERPEAMELGEAARAWILEHLEKVAATEQDESIRRDMVRTAEALEKSLASGQPVLTRIRLGGS